MPYNIEARIALAGEKEYRQAVTSATTATKEAQSELKLLSEQFKGQANTMEALRAKHAALANSMEALQRRENALREAMENARTAQSRIAKNLEELNNQRDEEARKLEELKQAYGESSDEVKEQQQVIDRLSRTIDRGNRNLATAGNRVSNWTAQWNDARTATIRMERELDQTAARLREAENSADGCAHSIDEYGREIRQAADDTSEWADRIKDAAAIKVIGDLTDGLKELTSAAAENAVEMQKAGNQAEAALGATAEEAKAYKETMAAIYANNYGENFDEISEAVVKVKQNLKGIDDSSLQDVTESAFALQDVFDMDMSETLRGANSLMYQFGLTAEEAMDLLGAGAQAGLNYTDELGDNLSEYAGKFSQAGYGAKEYFQLLENGTSNGAYNLDKVNDAINEVTTGLADGTVEESLGMYSEGTRTLFLQWQEGGATQKQVIDSIVADIAGCQNQQEALNMAAQAFGTMAEDGNLRFIQSLTSMGDSFADVQGKMNAIKDTKYDDLNSQITGLSRTIQMQLGEQIEEMLPLAAGGLEVLSENLEAAEGGAIGLGVAIAGVKLVSFINGLEGATVATKLLNFAMSLNPWTAIALAIGTATGALAGYMLLSEDAGKSVQKQQRKVDDCKASYDALKESIDEHDRASEESKTTAEENAAVCQNLADKLFALQQSGDASSTSIAQMSGYVSELNDKIPGLNLAIDETTGKLNMEEAALNGTIQAMRNKALAAAAQEDMSAAATDLYEAQKQLSEAQEVLNELEKEAERVQNGETKAIEASAYATGGAATAAEEHANQVAAANRRVEEQKALMEDLEGTVESQEKKVDDLAGTVGSYTAEANKATAGTEELSDASGDAASAAEETAEAFNNLKESVADSIENSVSMLNEFSGGTEVTAEEVKKNLDSQIEGMSNWSDNMQTLAGAAGQGMTQELYDALVEMGPQSANLVNTLVETLTSDMENGTSEFQTICQKWTEAMKMQDESEVIASYTSLGDGLKPKMEETGKNIEKSTATGIEAGKPFSTQAAQKAAEETLKAAQSNAGEFPSVGRNMMAGVALGMNANSNLVYSAVRTILGNAKKEANKATDSHSPSRVWRYQVGAHMPQGLALGILDGKKDVVSASVELARAALKGTKDELEINSPSKKFKNQVGKEICNGVAFGIKENAKAPKEEAKKLSGDIYTEATKWLRQYRKKNGTKSGTMQALQNELYYWQQVKKALNSGTDAYRNAEKKISEAKKKISDRRKDIADKRDYGVSGGGLELYKSLYNVSAKAEVQYWEQVRKSRGLSAEQRIEIDKNILEAKENYYEQMKELEDEYSEKCEEVNEKLRDDVQELTEAYTETLKERKTAIKDSFGLFDEFKSEAESPEKLLANMQSQVAGYALWMEQLEELEEKHVLNDALLEELRQMGPEAAATIVSLNQMTDEQLRLANEAYEEKDRLAAAQAEKELESLRTETEKQIQALEQAAQAELDAYKAEYEKASAELSEAISAPLKNLAKKATTLGEDATAKLILGFKKTAESKETKQSLKEIQWTITDGMAKLPDKGKKIGKNTLAGILDGLSDKLEIQKGAKSFVVELEAAIKKEAGIASPSKRFRDAVGREIPAGVGQGIEADTRKATDAGVSMVNAMLEQSAKQARRQQDALMAQLAGINAAAGIAALNGLTATQIQPAPNVTVNNTGVAEMVGIMTAEIRALRGEIGRMKIMLDKDTLVGELAEPIGDELAMQTIRL